jgi:hypothetical protein
MIRSIYGVKRAFTATMAIAMAVVLVSCGDVPSPGAAAVEPLGDFKLGFAIAIAKNAEQGPMSRDATTEELETALISEIKRVFGVYKGDKFYNVVVSVDAYVLALPGIPLVFSPKSALVVSLNVWDDQKGERITEEHKRFTILEKITGGSLLLGSGLTQSREEQLAALVQTAVFEIHKWLRENEHVFGGEAETASEG